jgi:hypothetical protein
VTGAIPHLALQPATHANCAITSPGNPWDDWEYSDAGVARGTLSGGDKLLGVHLCGPAGVYMIVWWERARGDKGRKIYPRAAPASSILVLLFSFWTIMTSFSATKLILSKPFPKRNHNIKTALLIFDVTKLTLRIVSKRGKADDLYGLKMYSFLTGTSKIMLHWHRSENSVFI